MQAAWRKKSVLQQESKYRNWSTWKDHRLCTPWRRVRACLRCSLLSQCRAASWCTNICYCVYAHKHSTLQMLNSVIWLVSIYRFYHISLNSPWNEKCFRQTLQRKSKHIFCVQLSPPPPRKSFRLWDNVEKCNRRGRHQITIWRMRIACWVPKATSTQWHYLVEANWNVMAHAQKPDFVFRRNGRVHLNRPGGVSPVEFWQPRCAHQR